MQAGGDTGERGEERGEGSEMFRETPGTFQGTDKMATAAGNSSRLINDTSQSKTTTTATSISRTLPPDVCHLLAPSCGPAVHQ